MQVKMQELKVDIEMLTSSRHGKECDKAVYCHFVCIKYVQGIVSKMPRWMTSLIPMTAGMCLQEEHQQLQNTDGNTLKKDKMKQN